MPRYGAWQRSPYVLAVWSWYMPWSGMRGDQLTTLAPNAAPNVMITEAGAGAVPVTGACTRCLPLTPSITTNATTFGIHMNV